MLDQLGEERAARRIEGAVMHVVKDNLKGMSAGEMGYTTAEVGDLVADYCVTSSGV
jgi:3-isopropylmalate dehydrogenase